jgi:hypothetical protein
VTATVRFTVEAWVVLRCREPLAELLPLAEPGSGALHPAGDGWWLLSMTTDAVPDVVAALTGQDWLAVTSAGPESGFLWLGDGAGVRRYVFGSPEELRLAALAGRDEAGARLPLHGWARGRTPKAPTAKGERSLWERVAGAKSSAVAGALWPRLGLVDGAAEPWRALAGCLGLPQPLVQQGWFGLRSLVDVPPHLVIGRGEGYFGIWDWDHPDREPAHRYPMTPAGLDAAREEHYRLALAPILDTDVIDGERLWTRAESFDHPVLLVWTGDRRLFLVVASPVPVTWLTTGPGRAQLPLPVLLQAGVPATEAIVERELRTIADVRRVAELWLSRGQELTWQEVPDGVPRRLSGTLGWLARSAR